MKELSFADLFSKSSRNSLVPDVQNNDAIRACKSKHIKYATAMQAIELLRNIKVEEVTPELAFMYAVDNGDTNLDTTDSSTWDTYAGKHEVDIKANTILNCLNMIDLLIEPFRHPIKDVYTMGLPKDVTDRLNEINFDELFIILNSDSYSDFNPIPVLELSIRSLTNYSRLNNDDPYGSTSKYRGYPDVITMEEVCKIFRPFIDKCSFTEEKDPYKLIQKYPSRKIRQYALIISIMYRLFYFEDCMPEDIAEKLLSSEHYTNFRTRDLSANCPITSWILSIPYLSPEIAIGITTPKRYSCKHKFVPSIPELNDVKTYLILLYNLLLVNE